MDITLRQVRYFVTVADAGKMSLAATELGVSQSVITEAVKSLEAQAGARLIERHGRGVGLTLEGYQFLSHARTILAAVSDAAQSIRGSDQNLRGRVKLGVTPTVAGYYLATPLARFQRIFQSAEIIPVEVEQSQIQRRLIDDSLDLGLMLVSNLDEEPDIAFETLFSSQRRLWLPPNHALLGLPSIHLKDVAAEPYLLASNDENDRTTARYWSTHGLQPKIAFQTSSMEAVRSLVANGCGVTILSDMVYRPWSLEGARVEARTLAENIPPLRIGLAWKRTSDLGAVARMFRQFCVHESRPPHGPFTPNLA